MVQSPRLRKLLLFTLGIACLTGAPQYAFSRDYGRHEGYLSTTKGEREMQIDDMLILHPPRVEGPTLRERIFNDKLSKEFRERYEEKFGRTEVQRAYYSPNKYTFYDDMYGFRGTAQEANDERRRFGEFMVRRLAEFHIDNYAKSDPQMRTVWEAKERLSNVQLEVSNFRFDLAYSIAGNILDVKMVNPWVESRVSLQMAGNFGPGGVDESIIFIGKDVAPTVRLESSLHMMDGIVSIIGKKSLTPNLGTSLSASTFTRDHGKSVRESVYLSGMSYSF